MLFSLKYLKCRETTRPSITQMTTMQQNVGFDSFLNFLHSLSETSKLIKTCINCFRIFVSLIFNFYIQILVVKSCLSPLKTTNKRFSGSFNGGWVSQYGGADQFLQIDLGNVTKVTRIATQGRYDAGWWTKTYTLSYSNDGAAFTAYKNGQVTLEYSDPRHNI